MTLPEGAELHPETDGRDRLLVEIDERLRVFGLALDPAQRADLNSVRQQIYARYRELTSHCYCKIGVEGYR